MKQKKAEYSSLSRDELLLLCIGDVISELVQAHHDGKDVNLNKTKTRIASKYGLETSPRLVDIIAAVPSQYKKVVILSSCYNEFHGFIFLDSCSQVTSKACAHSQWYCSGSCDV